MCSGTLGVLNRVKFIVFKVIFLLNSMALMIEILNSCVYGVTTRKILIPFYSGEHRNFSNHILRGKWYYKTARVSRSVGKYVRRSISSLLKKRQSLFLKLYMKLKGLKDQKLMDANFLENKLKFYIKNFLKIS